MLKNMSIRSAGNKNYYLQMINTKIFPILSEIKTYLTSLYQERLADLLLYGSQARGDAKPESDIDILVTKTTKLMLGKKSISPVNSSPTCVCTIAE
ncbi:MAG: hypothetical protein Fur0025_16940 [Oscillatoriaceae cyanobacterium]